MRIHKIQLLANINRLFFLFFICILACQNNQKEVAISLEESSIFANKKYEIQSQFFQRNTLQNISAEYTALRGKIEKGIYQAPEKAGQDTITILHAPSNFKKEIVIDILPAPELSLSLDRMSLHCKESISLEPVLKSKGKDLEIHLDEVIYQAEKGKFIKNIYYAPEKEGEDTIRVSVPSWNLMKDWKFSILSTPVFMVEIAKKSMETEEKVPFEVFLKLQDQKNLLSEKDYTAKAEKGTIQGNLYIAPKTANKDILLFQHTSGQKVEIVLEIRDSILLEVEIPKNKLNINEEMPVVAKLYKSKVLSTVPSELKFLAKLGKFIENIYHAPDQEGMETIQVLHAPSGIEKKFSIQIEYSPYQFLETERFRVQVPAGWKKEQSEIGFRAKGPKMTEFQGAEVSIAFFPGLDFLDAQTIKMFFQQQKMDSRDFEESGEEEIILTGNVKATKVILENFADKARKSWWILAKHEGAVYILTFTGPSALFEGEKNITQEMLDSFVFKPRKIQETTSLKMETQKQKIMHDYFSMELPEAWDVKKIGANLLIASSKLHHQGKSASLFLMSYQQNEIKNLDVSLILLLFRQETVKDPTLKVTEETDISLSDGPAKMIAFEGGKESLQKTWIVATKSNTTAYGILIFAPIEIWNANPDFAMEILKSFKSVRKVK